MKEHLKDGKKYTLYGCKLNKCIYCPYKDECVTTKEDTKRGYRTIDDDGYLIYRKEMRIKMELESSKKIYAKRSGCVEPVFGQIKNNLGFNRFLHRGIRKVKGEFALLCSAVNLKRLHYCLGTKSMAEALCRASANIVDFLLKPRISENSVQICA